jgi:hypothetical protein
MQSHQPLCCDLQYVLTAHCTHYVSSYVVPSDIRVIQEVSINNAVTFASHRALSICKSWKQSSREKQAITLIRKQREADQNQNLNWPFNKTECVDTMSTTLFELKIYLMTFRPLALNDRVIRMMTYVTTPRDPTTDHYYVFT